MRTMRESLPSQTDFTEDLQKISVPVHVMHGDDDQIVPYADSAPLTVKLLQNGTLKTTRGFRTACLRFTPRSSTQSLDFIKS